jgi:hypothetical protein
MSAGPVISTVLPLTTSRVTGQGWEVLLLSIIISGAPDKHLRKKQVISVCSAGKLHD